MRDSDRDRLLRNNAARLFGYATVLARDRDRAGDLFQDCVVRAMSSDAFPAEERAFRSWLFAIMRNLWIDQMRRDARQAGFMRDGLEAGDGLQPVSLESVIVNQLAVRQAFAMLSDDHRDVLALVDIGGFSYEEAGRLLGVPRGTIMSRVSRARIALAGLLDDEKIASLPRPVGRSRNGPG